jgi:sugar phosphate isomerase/epimerase
MKLGVSSYSFRKYILSEKCDYLKICDLAKEIGFDGIEFINLDEREFGITTDCLATAKEIRAHCEKIGLEIIAYTVGANLLADDIDAMVKYLFDCIDVTEALGAKVMRHDVCSALPKNHLYNYKDAIADMVPHIRRVTEYAASKGIKTCTENHGKIFQAPERVEALIRAVNRENYGWLVDMGNFICVDADPVHSVTLAAPYAFHVHAKDFLFKSGETGICPNGFFGTGGGNFIRGTVIGHGVVPVKQCVSIFKKAGYEGWLSLEFEGMEDCLEGIEAGLDYLKKIV